MVQQPWLKHGTGPATSCWLPALQHGTAHRPPLRSAHLYRLVNHGPLAAKPAAHHELDAGTQCDAGVGLCGGWPAGEHSVSGARTAWCRECLCGFVHQLHGGEPGWGPGKQACRCPPLTNIDVRLVQLGLAVEAVHTRRKRGVGIAVVGAGEEDGGTRLAGLARGAACRVGAAACLLSHSTL